MKKLLFMTLVLSVFSNLSLLAVKCPCLGGTEVKNLEDCGEICKLIAEYATENHAQ